MKKLSLLVLFLLGCVMSCMAQPYFKVRVNKQWGLINHQGEIVLKPQFTRIYIYEQNSNFMSAQKGDSVYLLDETFNVLVATKYSAIDGLGDHMFRTKQQNWFEYFGLMDDRGHVIAEPKFSSIDQFRDGVARVGIYLDSVGRQGERFGIIDKKGAWIVPPIYEEADLTGSSDGLIRFRKQNKWGLMNTSGRVIITPQYAFLGPCYYGYMEYSMTDVHRSGLMKRDGTITIPDDAMHRVSYRPATSTDTLVVVSTVTRDQLVFRSVESKVYTRKGRYLFEIPFTNCTHQLYGHFLVGNYKGKRGLIDSNGKLVIKPKYDAIQWDQPGLMQALRDKKWGFIDRSGKEVIPFVYDKTEPFRDGLAAMYVGGDDADYLFADRFPNIRRGYVDVTGKIVWKPSW